MQQNEPLIANSIRGWVTLAGTLVAVVLIPVFGFVAYWMRRGPDKEIADLNRDLNALGEKVDRIDKEQKQTRTEVHALERTISGNQRELIELITANGKALDNSVHAVDLNVARLQERIENSGNITECFDRLNTTLREFLYRPKGG